MSDGQILGVALLAALAVAVVGGTSWLMAQDHGWRLPLALWAGAFAFAGLFVVSLRLALGSWT